MKCKNSLWAITLFMAVSGLIVTSCRDNNNSDTTAQHMREEKPDAAVNTKDSAFVVKVVDANYAEIALARLAEKRGTSPEIKSVAQMLDDDHTKLLNQLQQYAQKNNIAVPDSASQEAMDEENKLADTRLTAFDRQWCHELVDKHKATIDKLEKAQQEVSDTALKTWIGNSLPIIRTHLDKLMQCEHKM